MDQPELLALVRRRAYEALINARPITLLGSGFTMGEPYLMPGMSELGERIITTLRANPRVPTGLVDAFEARTRAVGYERAVDEVAGMKAFADDIITVVQGLIQSRDLNAYERLVLERPSTGFAAYLEHHRQSSNPPLVVLTTNYDRIVEYECGLHGVRCYTGFAGGYISDFRETGDAERPKNRRNQPLVVDLYKIHGSLGWYVDDQDRLWRLPLTGSPRPGLRLVMILPGDEKFEATHQGVYRKLMTASDVLVRGAASIFVVGYGFNDSHVHEPLREGTARPQRPQPIVVLARTLTERCELFLTGARRHLALSSASNGTLVTCDELPNSELLENANYWKLDAFMELLHA